MARRNVSENDNPIFLASILSASSCGILSNTDMRFMAMILYQVYVNCKIKNVRNLCRLWFL